MYVYMLSDYLKEKYGKKLYKLLLQSSMTCPNRDGKCGTRGCIFCSELGSGEHSQTFDIDTNVQIKREIARLGEKEREAGEYIAYFQAFSNTYDSAENLRKLYLPVVQRADIKILDIATRPDCLNDSVLEVLSELNSIKPLWVELGLQSTRDDTAEYIRRGYPLSVYIDSALKLKARGIKVITHLILGLPNESKLDMINSAKLAGKYSDGIKFHALLINKNTDIFNDYEAGKFKTLSLFEYTDILCDCIRSIPQDVVVHRLTSDGENDKLIAPLWALDKVKALREINNAFYDKDILQGEYLLL